MDIWTICDGFRIVLWENQKQIFRISSSFTMNLVFSSSGVLQISLSAVEVSFRKNL